MILLTIGGNLPSLNEYTKANRTGIQLGAQMKRQTETRITSFIQHQLRGKSMIERAFIEFVWVEKNKKRDLDNIAFAKKFILDSLVNNQVLKNDNWSCVIGFKDRFEVDKTRPRIEVYIHEVNDEKA